MFVNNVEMRFPPVLLPFVQDNLSFVVFHDMGNVFESGQEMIHSLLRWAQPDRTSCESLDPSAQCSFNYLSHAVGAGVRYRTPIGPVRVDFGYNLNPPTFPVRQDAVRGPHIETLRRFNFFFSIGQTF
jgi:outer membrane protein insertion porin family